MSINADPLFVVAEAQWRRQLLTAAYPKATMAGRDHTSVVRRPFRWSLLHLRRGRHSIARHA